MQPTYVIAGGSRGIGLELVRLLAASADRIDVWSRSTDDLVPGGVIRHLPCDFAAPESPLPELPDQIHGAVYCPGTITLRSFRGLQLADVRQDLEINLLGAMRFLQACQPRLAAHDGHPASVVLFSTVAVRQGLPMQIGRAHV